MDRASSCAPSALAFTNLTWLNERAIMQFDNMKPGRAERKAQPSLFRLEAAISFWPKISSYKYFRATKALAENKREQKIKPHLFSFCYQLVCFILYTSGVWEKHNKSYATLTPWRPRRKYCDLCFMCSLSSVTIFFLSLKAIALSNYILI